MPVVFTGQQLPLPLIEGMAPDNGTWRAADTLARGGKIGPVGQFITADATLLWAAFPEGRRPDALAAAVWPQAYVACTCAGVRFPCRHILALLLLHHSASLAETDPPAWATARLAEADCTFPAAVADDNTIRRAAVGLDEMARWLGDQLDRGLAAPAAADRRPWLAAADRLADTYAAGAARELRELAALPGSGADWPERLLPRLGRLALLAAAFRRLDELPSGERGDAQAAAGLPPPPGDDRVTDTWLALGRRQSIDSGQRATRTWLRGLASDRWALLEAVQPARRLEGLCLPTGGLFDGELAFLPSAWPLAAEPVAGLRLMATPIENRAQPTNDSGAQDIAAAVAAYAAARAANPWLGLYPLLLTDVFAEPAPAGWRLRDRRGRLLPLPPRFGHGWQLLALAGEQPLTLFAEYDGATLAPVSVLHDGRWHDLAAWKGLP